MKITDIKVLKEGTLSVDVPNEDWLADKIDYAKSKGRNSYGVPYMGSTTASVRGTPPRVRVLRLASLPGMRNEQTNVRKDDLKWLMDYMDKNKRLPPANDPNEEYLPYIMVAYNGEAWVNEGNHRIMAAYRLNWPDMPIEIRYFDGGERVRDGAMYPGKIGLGEVDVPKTESVTEAFDKPYPVLRWETGDFGDVDAIARLDDNTFLSIMFNKGVSKDSKEEAWSVEFYRNNSQEVTGEGDAQRVFATVLSAIQTFIEKYKPNRITFSASKEVEPGQNTESRARLYDSLVQRYARSWGFRAFRADTGNKVIYELNRIKPLPTPEPANESVIVEGGWASTETQNTVITPRTVAEIVHILDGFEASYNAWQAANELDAEIKIGRPKGSGTYYRRDLEQDPNREYGDVDVECFVHSRKGSGSAQRVTEYRRAIKDYCAQSPDFSTDNGTNVIMRTTAGPVQVDLIYTFHEHADWSRVLSPEYRVKGVISTSLTSSIAEALNLSFSSQGIQVKIRNNQPVSFRQSKDTELRTVSINPDNWAQDIYSLYYYLSHGEKPAEMPRDLQAHGGLKDEQRLSDIVLSIKALASALEESNLLGHGSLIDIHDKKDLIRRVAQIYSAKLEAAENSSKFDKASTPAAVEKAKKTKLMLAKYRNEVTKLLLN